MNLELGTLLLLVCMVVVVLLGARLAFRNRRLPAGVRLLFDTGTVFILFGWLIGPQCANLLTGSIISQLGPVLCIGLGWVGFLYGINFEWRRMRLFSGRMYMAALTVSLFSFIVVTAVAWLGLPLLFGIEMPFRQRAAESLVLGLCAMGTAPAGTYLLAVERRLSDRDSYVLQFFSSVDDLPALALLGIVIALLNPVAGPFGSSKALGAIEWLALPVCLGIVTGIVTKWVFPSGDDVRHDSLVLLAMVSLGGGAAALLRTSPLFVCAIAGMVFANICPLKEKVYALLVQSEHSLYVVILLLAGAMFRFQWQYLYVLVPAFVLIRAAAKVAGGWVGTRALLASSNVSAPVGAGLLFQGGMALAILVSLAHAYPGDISQYIVTTIVLAVIVNELIAPWIAGGLLAGKERL